MRVIIINTAHKLALAYAHHRQGQTLSVAAKLNEREIKLVRTLAVSVRKSEL